MVGYCSLVSWPGPTGHVIDHVHCLLASFFELLIAKNCFERAKCDVASRMSHGSRHEVNQEIAISSNGKSSVMPVIPSQVRSSA